MEILIFLHNFQIAAETKNCQLNYLFKTFQALQEAIKSAAFSFIRLVYYCTLMFLTRKVNESKRPLLYKFLFVRQGKVNL